MDNKEKNKTYAEILNSLLILGMREAAYSLSIVINKAITIDEPKVSIISYEEVNKQYNKLEGTHRVTMLNYDLFLKEKIEKGLIVFQFSNNDENDSFKSILDNIQDKSETLKTSIVKEITNILGCSMIKVLANKTDITMDIRPPKHLIGNGKNIIDTVSKELDHNAITSDKVIIFETAFIDLNKTIQLKMFFIPGKTYQIFIDNIIKNRISN